MFLDCCSHNCIISNVGWGPFDSRRSMRHSVSSSLSTGIKLTKGTISFLEHFVISLLCTVPYTLYETYKMVYAFHWLLRPLKNVCLSCSQWIQFFYFIPIITWLCQRWRIENINFLCLQDCRIHNSWWKSCAFSRICCSHGRILFFLCKIEADLFLEIVFFIKTFLCFLLLRVSLFESHLNAL